MSPPVGSTRIYRMADVYRGAQFMLVMIFPPAEVTEEQAWMIYRERPWTFPEALLSRELRSKFRDGEVTPITLHQLANRAYHHFAESTIINLYGLKDPLERLERLSLLKSALWRRTSSRIQQLDAREDYEPFFRMERVYTLMGFCEHRIDPHFHLILGYLGAQFAPLRLPIGLLEVAWTFPSCQNWNPSP